MAFSINGSVSTDRLPSFTTTGPKLPAGAAEAAGSLISTAKLGKSFSKVAKSIGKAQIAFKKQYPQVVHAQASRQAAVIKLIEGEGSRPGQLFGLVMLHDRLLQLDALASDSKSTKKPLFHLAASDVANEFLQEASRLAGTPPSEAMAVALQGLEAGVRQLSQGNVNRFAATAGAVAAVEHSMASTAKAVESTASTAHTIAVAVGDSTAAAGAAEVAGALGGALPIVGVVTSAVALPGKIAQVRNDAVQLTERRADEAALKKLQGQMSEESFANLAEGARYRTRLAKEKLGLTVTSTGLTAVSLANSAVGTAGVTLPGTAIVGAVTGGARLAVTGADKVVKHREAAFTGGKSSEFGKNFPPPDYEALVNTHGLSTTLSMTTSLYEEERLEYDRYKLNSIMLDVLAEEKSSPRSPEQRRDRIAAIIDPDRLRPAAKGLLQGSTSRPSDITAMNRMLQDDYDSGLLDGRREDIEGRLYDALISSPYAKELKQQMVEPIVDAFIKELKKIKEPNPTVKHFLDNVKTLRDDTDALHMVRCSSRAADHAHTKATLKVLTPLLKADAALARTRVAGDLANLSRAMSSAPPDAPEAAPAILKERF